jgi:cell division cycle 2-like protein
MKHLFPTKMSAPQPAHVYIPGSSACRNVNRYKKLNRISQGAYGVVYRAEDTETGEIVALKRLIVDPKNDRDGFPVPALRDIHALFTLRHENIISLKEVCLAPASDNVFMVMEICDEDLRSWIRSRKQQSVSADADLEQMRCFLRQILSAVHHIHSHGMMHRDLKPPNILLKNGVLKIADFGLARPLPSEADAILTTPVQTVWYRAPELLLGAKCYGPAIDLWSVGCIFAEMVLRKALFESEREIEQIDKIFRIVGTPNEASWPGYTKLPACSMFRFKEYPHRLQDVAGLNQLPAAALDLLRKLLLCDPNQRITAEQALLHPWLASN